MTDRLTRCTGKRRWSVSLALACVSVAGSPFVLAAGDPPPPMRQSCDQGLLRSIPSRPSAAPSGSEFARLVRNLSGPARDALVRAELLSGNVPDFLRRLVPVPVKSFDAARPVKITVCVLPDYLALGSDIDFVFVPLGLGAALDVAHRFGFALPTPRLVDAIYEESPVKLQPLPLPASAEMRSTAYFVYHNELIGRERAARAAPLGELTAGDKKDLVLTNLLWQVPGRVAIYGWHRAIDQPIQPLSIVHGARYADYSHGVRLVSSAVYVDGVKRSMQEVLAEPFLGRQLTREGALPHLDEHLEALRAQWMAGTPTVPVARIPADPSGPAPLGDLARN
jgi:hypothetical protein